MSVFGYPNPDDAMPSDRITIVVSDSSVYLSAGIFIDLDLSSAAIPNDVHAFQFRDGKGWIEYVDGIHPEEPINSKDEIPQWVTACISLWNEDFSLLSPEIISPTMYSWPACDWTIIKGNA